MKIDTIDGHQQLPIRNHICDENIQQATSTQRERSRMDANAGGSTINQTARTIQVEHKCRGDMHIHYLGVCGQQASSIAVT